MSKIALLDADGNPIGASKPKPVILDAKGEWLDGDNKGELVLKRTQEVPDEFWEYNNYLRELSRINGPGWLCPAVHMPEIVEEKLHRLYPHVDPAKGAKPGQERVREVIKCLRLMGEERCITTYWSV